MEKILILSPHPDDEIIGCGCLLAWAQAKGIECRVIFASPAAGFRQLVSGKTFYDVRKEEVKAAAKFFGFSYSYIYDVNELVHLDAIPQVELISLIEDCIDEFRPSKIFIPSGDSYNQDHRAIYQAAVSALRPVPRQLRHFVSEVLMYEEPYAWGQQTFSIPKCGYEYLAADLFVERKLRGMEIYKSQDRDDPFPRSRDSLKRHLAIWGSECGISYAERYGVLRRVVNFEQ
jgi:LmbE family N-acetylglucosaminyl deacetylase